MYEGSTLKRYVSMKIWGTCIRVFAASHIISLIVHEHLSLVQTWNTGYAWKSLESFTRDFELQSWYRTRGGTLTKVDLSVES
jgi:hypothetical protein